jgi:hypothetical protein
MSQTLLDPAEKEIETQLERLRIWCAQARGRRTAAARSFGVEPPRVTEWLAGRTIPSLPYFLRIKSFMDSQTRKMEMKT